MKNKKANNNLGVVFALKVAETGVEPVTSGL